MSSSFRLDVRSEVANGGQELPVFGLQVADVPEFQQPLSHHHAWGCNLGVIVPSQAGPPSLVERNLRLQDLNLLQQHHTLQKLINILASCNLHFKSFKQLKLNFFCSYLSAQVFDLGLHPLIVPLHQTNGFLGLVGFSLFSVQFLGHFVIVGEQPLVFNYSRVQSLAVSGNARGSLLELKTSSIN
jgi:hypothetical protein